MNIDDIKKIFINIDNIKEFKIIDNSFSQNVYYVNGTKKYILKMYENKDKGENELKYLKYFNNKIRIPKVYKNDIYNNNFYIIMEYIEGNNYQDEDYVELENNYYKKIGNLLATMHSLKPIDKNNWNSYMMYRVKKNYNILKNKNIKLDKCYHYLIDNINSNTYNKSPMHADFRMGNLIINDNVFMIDLESVKTGDPVFDFVKLYRIFNKNQFELFVSGYKEILDLPNNFMEKLHFYNLYDAFTTMGWCIEVNRFESDFYNFNLNNLEKELRYLWKEEATQNHIEEDHFSLNK